MISVDILLELVDISTEFQQFSNRNQTGLISVGKLMESYMGADPFFRVGGPHFSGGEGRGLDFFREGEGGKLLRVMGGSTRGPLVGALPNSFPKNFSARRAYLVLFPIFSAKNAIWGEGGRFGASGGGPVFWLFRG